MGEPTHVLTEAGTARSVDLLRRLARNDPDALTAILAPPILGGIAAPDQPTLDPLTASLVRLTALLMSAAPVTTLRWAVELAAAHGADDEAIVATLAAAAPMLGSAGTVAAAVPLAQALGFEVDAEIGADDQLGTEQPEL